MFDEELSTCNHPWAISQTSKCYEPGSGSSGGNNEIGEGSQNHEETQDHHHHPRPPHHTTHRPTHRPTHHTTHRPTHHTHRPTHHTTHRPTHHTTHRPPHHRPPHRPIPPHNKPECVCPNQNTTNPIFEGGPDGTGVGQGDEDERQGCVCEPEQPPMQPGPEPECICPSNSTNPISEGGPEGTGVGLGEDEEGKRKCLCEPSKPVTEKPKPTPKPKPTQRPSGGCQQKPQGSGCPQGGGKPKPKPPASQPCSEEGFNPNPNDCKGFYRCVDFGGSFTKFDFQCGPGTMYHPEL